MRGMAMLIVLSAGTIAVAAAPAAEWPQWRGPFNTGMAEGDAPLHWDDRRNVRWKLAIPGRGHSTPVVADNRLFLTTAVPTGKVARPAARSRAGGGAEDGLEHRFEVIAVDRQTGKTVWQRTATVATPHEGYHGAYGSFVTWTAADGDELSTSFARRGVVAPPTITFTETHTITSGTGRFANASGTFTVVQTRGLSMPYNNSATIDGTINLGH